jgi:hypothetical protein
MQPKQQHKMLLVKDGKRSNAYSCDSNVSQYEAFYNIILNWNTKLNYIVGQRKCRCMRAVCTIDILGASYLAQIVVFKRRH